MKKIIAFVMALALMLPICALAEEEIMAFGGVEEGMFLVQTADRKIGFMDVNGNLVVPCIYDNASNFMDGLAAVVLDGKYGFIDKTGKAVIPLQYDRVEPFVDGLAKVNVGNEYFYINKQGEEVFGREYRSITSFSEGLAFVNTDFSQRLDWTRGFINTNNEVVLKLQGVRPVLHPRTGEPTGEERLQDLYLLADSFSEGLAAVTDYSTRKVGYINKQGEEVIPCQFKYARDFTNGMAVVSDGDFYGAINTKGDIVVPLKYETVQAFQDGMFLVQDTSNLVGYVNEKGEEVIPCQYANALPFSNGLAGVLVDGKIGFIDKTGKMVIEPQFENSGSFSEQYCRVCLNGLWGVIDKNGNYLYPAEYQLINHFGGYFVLKKDGKITVAKE